MKDRHEEVSYIVFLSKEAVDSLSADSATTPASQIAGPPTDRVLFHTISRLYSHDGVYTDDPCAETARRLGVLSGPRGELEAYLSFVNNRGYLRYAYEEPVLAVTPPAPPGGESDNTEAVEANPERPLEAQESRLGKPPDVQGYLYPPESLPSPAPPPHTIKWGINLTGVVGKPGWDGCGVKLAIIERGWDTDQDAPGWIKPNGLKKFDRLTRDKPSRDSHLRRHGTATLGVVGMDRGTGTFGWGVCGGARVRICTPNRIRRWSRVGVSAIQRTLLHLVCTADPGDVILVEDQILMEGPYRKPPPGKKEFKKRTLYACSPSLDCTVRGIVAYAGSQGVSVVFAAGNNSVDLGTITPSKLPEKPTWFSELESVSDAEFLCLFDMDASAGDKDYKGIVVGAASPLTRRRQETSNFGGPVNFFAWGSHVYTLEVSDRRKKYKPYEHQFPNYQPVTRPRYDYGGTSAAAAIVAGAAVVTQAMYKARVGDPEAYLTPTELIEVMKQGATTIDGEVEQKIGVMPDLAKIKAYIDKTWEPGE